MRDSHALSCYKNDFMINSYDAAHDPQKKFRYRSAALPTRKNGRLWPHHARPAPRARADDVGATWKASRTRRPLAAANVRPVALAGYRVRQVSTKSEGDRAFQLPQPTKHASASDRSRLALRWNIRSRVVSRAYGSAARADHISLARNSFLNFRTIGEKSWRRIRQ